MLEQAEYAKEGVACADIHIDDNSAVLKALLDKPAGQNEVIMKFSLKFPS